MSPKVYTAPAHIQNRIDRIPAEQRRRDLADYDALRRVHRRLLECPSDGFPNQSALAELEAQMVAIEITYNL